MKTTYLKYLLLLLAFIPKVLWADDGGYYIRHYHVDMTVHENHVCDLTEVVDLTFTEERHGFYRYIPYTFVMPIEDENASSGERRLDYECDIDNIKVDGWNYEVTDESDNKIIRIGDADRTVIGEQRYIIHYTFTYPEDRIPEYDYFYHTLLPVDCYVPINHFSFRIKFDKELDQDFEDNLWVGYGKYGESNDSEKVTTEFSNNVLMGYADLIEPQHTVTVYAVLNEGYYVGAKSVSPIPCMLLFGISLLIVLITIFYELKSKNPHITKTIEFYPPDDISSAEVGTIIDESVDLVDIASLIPWWASKGYITIKEIPDSKGRVGKHAKLELTKKDSMPNDAPKYQKLFMDLLFGTKNTVELSSLGNNPNKFAKVQTELNKVFSGKKELTNFSNKYWFIPLFAVTSTLMFCLSSPVSYFYWAAIAMALCIWLAPAFLGILWKEYGRTMQFMSSKWMHTIAFFARLIAMAIVCISWIVMFANSDNGSLLPVPLHITMFAAAFIMVELSHRFTTNSEYRVEMMGKLLGLKEFIETAEKPQLESLQNEDTAYYYKILPYAMVFGLTNKWSNLFADIEVERPSWYHSTVTCDNLLFTHNITQSFSSSALHDIEVISHSPSSSSGGGFSGGGFSGGGGGGGGCGSW